MSVVHTLKHRALTCATCPFFDGTPRAEMEAIAGMPMERLIREQGVICHEEERLCGALMQCPGAGPWLARAEGKR